MIQYPNIDPVLISFGSLQIRWYSLSYIAGILLGWIYCGWLNKKAKALTKDQYDSILTWVIIGIVLGGRLGYVLFYKPMEFLHEPHRIFAVWEGGMSFHGGMIGTILALWIFCRKNKIEFFKVIDLAAVVTPIGLGLGRLANFINGELYGRPTESEYGMIFPTDPLQTPRHASQLYEAFLEGFVMLVLLFIAFKFFEAWKRPKLLSGLFLISYGIFRSIVEIFREPDAHLGFLYEGVTMGQLLSAPMVLLGLYLVFVSGRKTANS